MFLLYLCEMKKIYLLQFLIIGLLISCKNNQPDARELINNAMKAHGTAVASNGKLFFNFRGIDYSVARDNGNFKYQRHLMIGTDTIVDQLDNYGFKRFKNNIPQSLADSLASRYSSSLNSVVYFAQLPYGLDSKAINLKYIGKDSIKEKTYHAIEVTFNQEGGGEDPEDVFIYWIDVQDYFIDYLAYSFCEEECGYRFRESENRTSLKNGVIIQDYNNFKPKDTSIKITELGDLFNKGELVKLSDIDLKLAEFVPN